MKLIENLVSDFKSLIESGKSKSMALDILCEKNKELINANFIRSIIRGIDGWYY